jgi:endonuclease-3 related protein
MELAELVRPAGFHTSKPRKLREMARYVLATGGVEALTRSEAPTAILRRELLNIWGIGPETADAVLLYALQRPVFVADAYAARLAARWGLLPVGATYDQVQALFMSNLPHDAALFNEYHALIVAHGKRVCCPKPLCEVCPLAGLIPVASLVGRPESWSCPRRFVPGRSLTCAKPLW